MIKCWLGTITSNPSKITKSPEFTKGGDDGLTISAYDEIDDITCDFVIDGAGLHGLNYMKVNWNGIIKYYFIETRSGMTGTRTKIRATCDVLYTYSSTILNAPCVINRTSDNSKVNHFLRDNRVSTTSNAVVGSADLGDIGEISNQEYYYVGVLQRVASEGSEVS